MTFYDLIIMLLKKSIKIALGLLYIPFCIGFTWQLGENIFRVAYKPDVPYYFLAGGITYLAIHVLFKKPILTYVFGHELTHALFAVLFGGSVKSFRASGRGGQVTVTKSNFMITLAPYFFPLYTFIALVLFFLSAAAEARTAAAVLIFAAGATFVFHLVLTVIFLQTDQKDIRENGAVFSYPLIYLFNIIFTGLLIYLLLARNNDFLDFLEHGIIRSIRIVVLLVSKLYGLVRAAFS